MHRQISLKVCIEKVRMNPKAYLKAHMSQFDQIMSHAPIEEIICLMFASAAHDTVMIFEKLDQVVSSQAGFPPSKVHAYYYEIVKGLNQRSLFSYTKAMSHFIQAYDIAVQLDDLELVCRVLMYLSSAFDGLGNREQALKYAQHALELVLKLEIPTLIGDSYWVYGLMHERQGNLFESMNAYHYAQESYERFPDCESYLNYCILLMNTGRNHLKLGHDALGEKYIAKGLSIAEEREFIVYLEGLIKVITDFYIGNGKCEKANEILSLFLQSHINSYTTKERNTSTQIEESFGFIKKLDQLHHLYRTNNQLNEELKILQSSMHYEELHTKRNTSILAEIGSGIRKGEFHPYLQLKFDIRTKRINGAEMLARWIKSDGSIVGPCDFIGAIENNDLIMPFTESLMHSTLKILVPYIHNVDSNFKVSFNVSPYQLANQDLVRLLESCCVQYHVAPKNIELEVIERTFIENNPKAINQLFLLKEKGYGLSLDDFGSGYSSLSCIIELPVDTVKIDRSLVKYIDLNEKSEKLFRSIVAMLKELDILIVAEGIETESQLDIVRDTGCDEGQGFLVHRPCDANEVKDCIMV
jgi:EAL domain-containing protein (putative c-di-GMP-specific phosphodiesterase class I)/tetratricopeptide (TPR) repeat protein